MPPGALLSPLDEGGFALDLANGLTWSSRFVAGPENALLAHAVGDVCARPGCPYNPLVLYGPTGIGKSHVAHGLARRVAATHVSAAVV